MNEEAKLTRVCTKCANVLPDGANFCPSCGAGTGVEANGEKSVGEMLVGFAQRAIDIDAVGHQLGGLETVKSFRASRGIWPLDPDDSDLEGVGEAAAPAE